MLFSLTVTQSMKMLRNLDLIIEKAAASATDRKFDADVLLSARLAPDQFAFVRQVQIACDTAKLGVSRLTGKPAPSHADDEKTVAELRARIHSTLGYLEGISATDFVGAETVRISQPRWAGKSLSGLDFAEQHFIPNFYFHVTTAYALLRHNGVNVGKMDYLGALPYRDAPAE